MKNSDIKRAFRKFLYDNDALEAWYANTSKERRAILFKDIDREIISSAFTWSNSPEGHDFWSELMYKWYKMWDKM